ncbi:MAG: DEAD/DEAH box helicase [Phycisphaera sp.]|nr:DEAD/DEAH box helicase [Phycisphaera sp.]
MNEVFSEVPFSELGLSEQVMKGLDEYGFKNPTHIQAQIIGPILAGRDVLGQAKTGTGKTAAFGLPILSAAEVDGGVQALVLAPTRELALQIVTELNKLGKHTGIKALSVVGGEKYTKQIEGIKKGCQIVVATPGRVMDLFEKRIIPFDKLKWVVLDEVDRMLDIGFRDDIRRILGKIRQAHQTVFVSATIHPDIEKLARQFMNDDMQRITTVANALTVSQVVQKYIPVKPWDKRKLLIFLLTHEEPALTVVFCRTKKTVDKVAEYLNRKDIEAFAIHGDLPQSKRNRIIERLRSGKLEVLVASDLASRGLDVEGITHIINYDLPEDPEVYVHRIGRTARAGREGTAWSFVEPDQGQLLTEIEKLASVHIENLNYDEFVPSPQPANWTDAKPGSRPAGPPPKRRSEGVVGVPDEVDSLEEAAKLDPTLFPGGIIPKGKPKKTLGSRFKSGRR